MSAARDLPRPTPETAPFWDGCRAGKLLIQRCRACGHRQFYPRLLCTACSAPEPEWIEACGRAVIESFTIVRQAIAPDRAGDVPDVIALVRLDEGPAMMTNIVDCDPGEVAIGLPVRVAFERLSDDIHLPVFRPAPPSAGASQP
jgi:uncharacterized OB-fold protein